MEVWHIAVICILMVPFFLAANYLLVKKMAAERRLRDDKLERAASDSVRDSYRGKGLPKESWPKYRPARKKR